MQVVKEIRRVAGVVLLFACHLAGPRSWPWRRSRVRVLIATRKGNNMILGIQPHAVRPPELESGTLGHSAPKLRMTRAPSVMGVRLLQFMVACLGSPNVVGKDLEGHLSIHMLEQSCLLRGHALC